MGFPLGAGKKFGEDQAGNLAALISYYTFFSIFPLLLALVTILGLVLKGNLELQHRIVGSALAQFPVIGNQIRDNIGSLGGNWLALLAGVGGALWAGMGAVDAAQNAMNSVWDVPIRDKPKFLTRRLRSLTMLVVIGGGLFLTAAGSTVASSADSIAWSPYRAKGRSLRLSICRVRIPKRQNCRFFETPAQAEAQSFRPCLKCRPEIAPGPGLCSRLC